MDTVPDGIDNVGDFSLVPITFCLLQNKGHLLGSQLVWSTIDTSKLSYS